MALLVAVAEYAGQRVGTEKNGAWVGLRLGELGRAVGLDVGLVGDIEGKTVGLVGLTDGRIVGLLDGDTVGLTVGVS